jgi:hypothetical protein
MEARHQDWLTGRQSQCDFDFDFAKKSPEVVLFEFRGSRVIEQEMARKLHRDLKC